MRLELDLIDSGQIELPSLLRSRTGEDGIELPQHVGQYASGIRFVSYAVNQYGGFR